MADKYIALISGAKKQVEAITTSAGAGDSGKIVALDAAGKLDSTMMPSGVGSDSASREASETLAAGDLVNVWNDGGTAKIRKADATATGKQADGYVLAGITATNSGTVYFDDTITGLTGLTPGATYYLNTTAGGITTTPPSTAGNVVQRVGRAISATELSFEPGEPIELV